MLNLLDSTAVENGQSHFTLDELAREGARRMLQSALEAEVADYVSRYHDERGADGKALVVRNGKAQTRQVTIGSGTMAVTAPRVNDKRINAAGERERFSSRILPPYMRRSPKVSEVLPVLYLRGLSTGDFQPALESLLGKNATGLSAANIARLTAVWEQEYASFRKRDLSGSDYAYVWVDGIHFNVRLEEDRLCTLVVIGARTDGTKEVLAVEDGYRESTESWASVLRQLHTQGLRAPLVAVGDGALGFWAAVRDVWPETQHQRCWVHKVANVLDKLPKRLQPRAKAMLHEIMYAANKKHAVEAIADFGKEFKAKYPKAVEALKDPALLTLFDFPAEHWVHLRSTNPIESAFATVRLRQRVTKGSGSRAKALLMAFKLLTMAELRWRKLNAPSLLEAVRRGDVFVDGIRKQQEQNIAA